MIPELIFLVPYRDRIQERIDFEEHMVNNILKNKKNYEIYYCHQKDNQQFNRGAMKNIGFLAMKEKYPNNYKDITFVFNDVDTMPLNEKTIKTYETTDNNIKHFFGFVNTLGGIISIKGQNFEQIRGFPNLWSWGYEDNELQRRVSNNNLLIDRNNFYHSKDPNIISKRDSNLRNMNRRESILYKQNKLDDITHIKNLEYEIIDKDIMITKFTTLYEPFTEYNVIYDTVYGNRPFCRGQPMKFI